PPTPPPYGRRATLGGRGPSMSPRSPYAKRPLAQSTPIRQRASTPSPLFSGTRATLQGARPLYERALAINEKVLGPEHANTNHTRSSFAGLLLATGAHTEALALGEKALTTDDKLLGRDD